MIPSSFVWQTPDNSQQDLENSKLTSKILKLKRYFLTEKDQSLQLNRT